jgi:hypothetical protein
MSWLPSPTLPCLAPMPAETLFALPSGLVEVLLFEPTGRPRAPRVTTCSNLKIARDFAQRFSERGFAVVFHKETELGWYENGQRMPGAFPAERLKVKRTWQIGLQLTEAAA